MRKKDVKTFGDAIAEGLSIRYEREMAGNAESAMCSDEHKAAMLEIVAIGHTIEQRMGRRRLLAILVAAALLLLAGCTAFVYRNEIGSFVENVFDEYVNVDLPDSDNNSLTKIEHVYTLSYVPEGYVLTEESIVDIGVMYIYTNEFSEQIVFDQSISDFSNVGIHNDGGEATVFKHNNREIYIRNTEKLKHIVWVERGYVITVTIPQSIDDEEVIKILDGIE